MANRVAASSYSIRSLAFPQPTENWVVVAVNSMAWDSLCVLFMKSLCTLLAFTFAIALGSGASAEEVDFGINRNSSARLFQQATNRWNEAFVPKRLRKQLNSLAKGARVTPELRQPTALQCAQEFGDCTGQLSASRQSSSQATGAGYLCSSCGKAQRCDQ